MEIPGAYFQNVSQISVNIFRKHHTSISQNMHGHHHDNRRGSDRQTYSVKPIHPPNKQDLISYIVLKIMKAFLLMLPNNIQRREILFQVQARLLYSTQYIKVDEDFLFVYVHIVFALSKNSKSNRTQQFRNMTKIEFCDI